MPDIQHLPLSELKPWPGNARTHSRKQVKQLADSIRRFGFTQPLLIDEDNRILAGHGRVRAARELGFTTVPCLRIDDLSQIEKRAYVLADNKLALNAGWDQDLLIEELKGLVAEDLSFEIGVTGFSIAETERLLAAGPGETTDDPEEERPAGDAPARCRPGDVWQLGAHWLVCRDELRSEVAAKLLSEARPRMPIAMPPEDAASSMSARMKADWTEAFIAAGEAGRTVLLSEADPARCDRIIRRWEAYAKATACRAGVACAGSVAMKGDRP